MTFASTNDVYLGQGQLSGSQQNQGRLVAVVATHNRLAQLQVTLPRLLRSSEVELAALVVVDNASNDGTAEWLAAQGDPRLAVLRNEINLGGAGGFERGMRHAVERFDPDWIVVMDDDSRPEPDALQQFHAAPRDDAEAWASAVYHPDGRICDINRPSINPFWNWAAFLRTAQGQGRDGFHLGRADYAAAPQAIDGASFVGLFISRAGLALAGFPDGRLFLYGDDVLYTLGLRRAGGAIRFDPALRFEHDFSTISSEDRRFRPLWKIYYHYRNLLMVYRLAAGWLFWPALLAVAPKWALKACYHGGERRLFLGLLARALRDGVLRRTSVPHEQVLNWVKR